MPDRVALEASLHRVLRILQPYLGELVLIGGWVPYLHRQYGNVHAWNAELSLTSELDVLVTERVSQSAGRPPLAALLAAAGLEPETPHQQDKTERLRPNNAAVWTGSHATGEAIEFLVAHTGRFRRTSAPVPVPGQPGIAAIMLTDLALLERHTTVVRIPLQTVASAAAERPESDDVIAVRIPILGAYLLNKAITFPKRIPRPGELVNSKRGKDLLYLRDLAAAGPSVIESISTDIRSMLGKDGDAVQPIVDAAASYLEAVARGAYLDDVGRAAAMLAERESVRTLPAAHSDITGHLADLLDLLERFRSPFSPPEDEE